MGKYQKTICIPKSKKQDLKSLDKIFNLAGLMLKNRVQIKKMMSKSIINTKNIKKNFKKYLKF